MKTRSSIRSSRSASDRPAPAGQLDAVRRGEAREQAPAWQRCLGMSAATARGIELGALADIVPAIVALLAGENTIAAAKVADVGASWDRTVSPGRISSRHRRRARRRGISAATAQADGRRSVGVRPRRAPVARRHDNRRKPRKKPRPVPASGDELPHLGRDGVTPPIAK